MDILIIVLSLIIIDFFIIFYRVDKYIENILTNYITIKNKITNPTKDFFILISEKMLKLFLGNNIYIYFPDDNNFILFYKKENIKINLKEKLNKKSLNEIKKMKYIIFEIVKEKKFFLIIIYFKNIINYLFSLKIYFFNKNKINTFITNLILDIYSLQKEEKGILEKIKDYAFIKIDKRLNIISYNEGAKYIFGYDENIYGKNIKTILKKENIENFIKSIELINKIGEEKVELNFKDINGNYIKTETLITKIDVNDIILGYFLIIKDVSREEIWIENLKNQVNLNKNILENVREGIILLKNDNKIKYVNDIFNKIFGIENIFIGRDIFQILPIQYAEKFLEQLEKIKKEKNIRRIDLKIYENWYNIKFFPIIKNNNVDEVLILLIDNNEYMQTQEKLRELTESIINDLNTARKLQESLIPEKIPEGNRINFEFIFKPSDQVGGDFFYIDEIKINNKDYYLTIMADVSGHGLGSSMFTVLVKDIYNDFKEKLQQKLINDITEYLKSLNNKIIKLNIGEIKFVTVFLSIIDIENREIVYTSAGHPHAIMIRENKLTSFGIFNSPPVGIIDEYNYKKEKVEIKKNDKVIIFSDGIVELFENDIKEFEKFLNENSSLKINEIKEKIEELIIEKKNKFQLDDITAILIEID